MARRALAGEKPVAIMMPACDARRSADRRISIPASPAPDSTRKKLMLRKSCPKSEVPWLAASACSRTGMKAKPASSGASSVSSARSKSAGNLPCAGARTDVIHGASAFSPCHIRRSRSLLTKAFGAAR